MNQTEKPTKGFTGKSTQKTCGICNRPIHSDWNFCPNCGNKISAELSIFDLMLKEDLTKCRMMLRPLIKKLSQIPFEIDDWFVSGPIGSFLGQIRISTRNGYVNLYSRINGTYDLQLDNYLEGHSGSILDRRELTLDKVMEELSQNIKYVL